MSRFERVLYKFVKNDGFAYVLSLLVMVFLFCHFKRMNDLIDYPVFSSVLITLIFNRFVDMLKKPVLVKLEDKVKLTTDYKKLTDRYKRTKNLIAYDNTGTADEARIVKRFGKKEFTFPVCCECMIGDVELAINDSPDVMYNAPDFVLGNFDKLIEAHKMSTIYNNLNIRVDDWYLCGDKFVMMTSRTTYFDSLITNRVMDYVLDNGICIRNMYEFGPSVNPLKSSKLSNHLGFNAFVESSDGEIAFVERGSAVSIGKKTYGNSIGASLKTKYVLSEDGTFNIKGLENGLLNEIKDELSIDKEFIESYRVIAAYRDLVEGGKPQLLVYARSGLDKTAIMQRFDYKKRSKAKRMESDGTRVIWVKRSDLSNLSIAPEGIMYQGRFLPMLPSASASVVMLIRYLKGSNN
ncbi:MAG: hypothetical protein IJA52_08925 [Clostridia bacterium]|nr:hypothetical protein [Clostridia bacterium]